MTVTRLEDLNRPSDGRMAEKYWDDHVSVTVFCLVEVRTTITEAHSASA